MATGDKRSGFGGMEMKFWLTLHRVSVHLLQNHKWNLHKQPVRAELCLGRRFEHFDSSNRPFSLLR